MKQAVRDRKRELPSDSFLIPHSPAWKDIRTGRDPSYKRLLYIHSSFTAWPSAAVTQAKII